MPADVGYADVGEGEIPPGATFKLEVELLAVRSAAPLPTLQPTELLRLAGTGRQAHVRVFRDLWERGWAITLGTKFGADYLVYPGDPMAHHAGARSGRRTQEPRARHRRGRGALCITQRVPRVTPPDAVDQPAADWRADAPPGGAGCSREPRGCSATWRRSRPCAVVWTQAQR